MKNFLLVTATISTLMFPVVSHAALILTFGQSLDANDVVATANAGNTATTIVANNAPVSVTQILGGVPTSAFFDLNLHSTDAATALGSGATQHYAGTFSVTSGINDTGTNLLSGSFSDILLGVGPSAVLAAGSPPDIISFTSDLIGPLSSPSAIALSFADVTPSFHIVGSTIASFDSSVSGTFSASPAAIPEPASFLLLGIGLLGVTFAASRKVS